MVLGPAGVGKTCLKRGLMGSPFNPSTNSTIVADVHSVRPMSREWITQQQCADEWSEVTERDEILELAQLMVLAGANKSLLSHMYRYNKASIPLSVRALATAGSSYSLEKIQELMWESQIVQKALVEAQKLKKCTLEDVKCLPFFHLWDCGGQPVFLEVLPLFLTSRTLFLTVFDASKDLEQPWVSLHNKDGKRYDEGKVNVSTLQMMERRIAMIYSHLLVKDEHGVDPGYPRVIPIGTRKDELIKSGGNPQDVMKVVGDSFKGKAFTQVVEEPMIIDNTTSGSSAGEDVGYKVVREKVLDMARSKLRRVNTPIAWILFRKLLQLVTVTSPNANIISKQEVELIAHISKVKPDDVDEVLQFYHELGVFLYYPSIEGLKEKVILDPKWFVECLGKVLTLSHFTDERYEDRNEWMLFRSKGIIVERLLHKTCQGIKPKELIELLAHFQLAVEVKTDQYFDRSMKQFFIPAILPYRPVSSVRPLKESVVKVAPLHVTFDSGFVVPGFFTRLSVKMLKESDDPQVPKLDLYFGHDDDNNEVYHDRVTYKMCLHESPSAAVLAPIFVTVTEENNFIAFDVTSYSNVGQSITEIHNNCLNLKSHVEACSDQVSQNLQSLHSNITESISSPMVKVVCQAHECRRKRIHYLIPPSLDGLFFGDYVVACEKNMGMPRKITTEEASAYWFKAAHSVNTTTTHPSAQEAYSLEDITNQDSVTSIKQTEQATMPMMWAKQESVQYPPPIIDDHETAPPEVHEVYSLLRDKAHEWDDIGRELLVPYNRRQEIRNESLSMGGKLEKVLVKWSESRCSDVSWVNVKKVLERLDYIHLAEEVKRNYL